MDTGVRKAEWGQFGSFSCPVLKRGADSSKEQRKMLQCVWDALGLQYPSWEFIHNFLDAARHSSYLWAHLSKAMQIAPTAPALLGIAFILHAVLNFISAGQAHCRTGLKTSAAWKPAAFPGEGVKPGQCWPVSCFCYDFCSVTESRPELARTGVSPVQLCQQGKGRRRRSRLWGQPPKSQRRVCSFPGHAT